MFEEFGAKPCIRPKQERLFPLDHACIKVWNGHWWRADPGFPVDFGLVAFDHCFVGAAEPDTADWKSTVALTFGDICLEEQWQRATTRSNKDKTRLHITGGSA